MTLPLNQHSYLYMTNKCVIKKTDPFLELYHHHHGGTAPQDAVGSKIFQQSLQLQVEHTSHQVRSRLGVLSGQKRRLDLRPDDIARERDEVRRPAMNSYSNHSVLVSVLGEILEMVNMIP